MSSPELSKKILKRNGALKEKRRGPNFGVGIHVFVFIESFTALAIIDLEMDMTQVQKSYFFWQIRVNNSVISASILLKVYVFNNHGYLYIII